MRVVFIGTSEFGCPTLRAIVQGGHDLVAVYTKAPFAVRGRRLKFSAVHEEANLLGLYVRTPETLINITEQSFFADLAPDVVVVVSYGIILPEAILNIPSFGCLNLHASLLPRWRGAAPVHRAIMAGDKVTGVTVIAMDKGIDTGPIIKAKREFINQDETSGELHDRLSIVGAELVDEVLAEGEWFYRPQSSIDATYAAKIDKSETLIDWHKPACEVCNFINGLSPNPGAWCKIPVANAYGFMRTKIIRSKEFHEDVSVKYEPGVVLDDQLTVACGAGAVRLLALQKAGGKVLRADSFLRGFSVPASSKLC